MCMPARCVAFVVKIAKKYIRIMKEKKEIHVPISFLTYTVGGNDPLPQPYPSRRVSRPFRNILK